MTTGVLKDYVVVRATKSQDAGRDLGGPWGPLQEEHNLKPTPTTGPFTRTTSFYFFKILCTSVRWLRQCPLM